MHEGPDIARIASLVGDPARANMLTALVGGTALTASELAMEAGVSLSTASSHLSKLRSGGLLSLSAQGRHRYYRLAGPQIAAMIETIMGVAAVYGPQRVRPGPRDKAMREARICYDHFAGDIAVAMLDGFLANGVLALKEDAITAGSKADAYFAARGIDMRALSGQRRPLCRSCLDWSARRSHLAGALGAAILGKALQEQWVRRQQHGRALVFTPPGKRAFEQAFLG